MMKQGDFFSEAELKQRQLHTVKELLFTQVIHQVLQKLPSLDVGRTTPVRAISCPAKRFNKVLFPTPVPPKKAIIRGLELEPENNDSGVRVLQKLPEEMAQTTHFNISAEQLATAEAQLKIKPHGLRIL
jgi:hypothetical protein